MYLRRMCPGIPVTLVAGLLDDVGLENREVLQEGRAQFGVVAGDTDVIYECLIALQKIRDESAARGVTFLLHDLDEKVQLAAIETVGLLEDKSAEPQLGDVLDQSGNTKVKRAALTSLAMLRDDKNRGVFRKYLSDKDEGLRAAAAEGFARLKNPADFPMIEAAFRDEDKMAPG